jgi:mannose-6-phosphate isomerase-like protein (cupin superfamily)
MEGNSMAKRASARHIRDMAAFLPPKHTNTDSWTLVSKETVGAEKVKLFLTEMRPGAKTDWDRHMGAEHAYFILSGRGKAYVENQTFDLEPNVCLFIPEDANHRLDVIGNETMRFVVLLAPPPQA